MSGRLIVMGSGEVAPALVATHRAGIEAAGAESVTILDTPFGFQENAEQLTERLVEYFDTSLRMPVEVASLRRPDAPAVTREQMLATVRRSRYVFAGPGSPSYALKVWRDTGLDDALGDVIAGGGTVTFASAAALTVGVKTIPVYEIYKVGEEPYWLDGLAVMSRFGLPITVIPHWNNAEGGNHDTSRCYIGERRLRIIEPELTAGIVGVDEHSAVTVDVGARRLAASGVGGVTLRGNTEVFIPSGESMSLAEAAQILGAPPPREVPREPADPRRVTLAGALAARDADAAAAAVLDAEERAHADVSCRPLLRSLIVELAEAARTGLVDPRQAVAPLVDALLELRAGARSDRRYDQADLIRDRLDAAGIEVRDTDDGVEWHLKG
jgi:hypothetical protein